MADATAKSGLIVSDISGANDAPPPAPPQADAPEPAKPAPEPIKPIVIKPPPSPHHPLNTGLSTELGDSAKEAIDKINKNFENFFQMLTGTKPASIPVATAAPEQDASFLQQLEGRISSLENGAETVAKEAFDSVVAKIEALEAALKNTAPKADFDALQTRFNLLAKKLEAALGLEPTPAPPPA